MIAFGGPIRPPVHPGLAADDKLIHKVWRIVPALESFRARDGSSLFYRRYPGAAGRGPRRAGPRLVWVQRRCPQARQGVVERRRDGLCSRHPGTWSERTPRRHRLSRPTGRRHGRPYRASRPELRPNERPPARRPLIRRRIRVANSPAGRSPAALTGSSRCRPTCSTAPQPIVPMRDGPARACRGSSAYPSSTARECTHSMACRFWTLPYRQIRQAVRHRILGG